MTVTCLRNLVIAVLFAVPLAAIGQTWPFRPVRLVVPYPPGASSDAFARPISSRLTESLGQPVVVDFRPGAGATIGADLVAKSAPDGHTILVVFSTHYSLPLFQKAVPYDVMKDFTPIIAAAAIPMAFAVHPSFPASTMAEFLDYARKTPEGVFFGSGGIGSPSHLAGEMLAQVAAIKFTHVPYKGGAPMMTEFLGGQIKAGFGMLPSFMPHAKNGSIRVLAVTQEKRTKSAPEIPSITETVPNYALPDIWVGILGPAGLPSPIVSRIHAEVRKALNHAEVRDRLQAAGFEITGDLSPAQLAESIQRSMEVFRQITSQAGIKPE